jgi:hypothetical protein
MLRNVVYKGVFMHGRARNIDKGGKRIQVKALASEIQTRIDETLRIVSEPLWTSAQDRIAKAREKWSGYRRGGGGQNGRKLTGRPEGQTTSQHLLGGLLRCGECGAMLIPTSRVGKSEKPRRYYACARRYKQGSVNCPFKHLVPYDAITNAVLSHFQELNEGMVKGLIQREWEDGLRKIQALLDKPDVLRDSLGRLEAEIERLMRAILEGDPPASLVRLLREKEAAKAETLATLEQVEDMVHPQSDWPERLAALAKRGLGALKETLEQRGLEGRQALRALIQEPIKVTQANDKNGTFVGWDYAGIVELGRVLEGQIYKRVDVNHARIAPRY